ncbi:hypothetical protein T439DRAFT_289966 [Meredithblackwellia eburnea MCA 4105]
MPAHKDIDQSRPPISNLFDIFTDLAKKVDVSKALKKLEGRKLRVGTMCSGTESPLLALGIFCKVLPGVHPELSLDVEHVFSCEIEPFKQAYIERNFAPPLLFRDVTELGDDEAHTAYGGMRKVPGGLDLLVAGTSCVDYSPLNVAGKTITGGGESGRTFFGMLDYVKRHRPKAVILENVSSAPWEGVAERFDTIDYEARFIRLDTKCFYIPHTRTRGYLIAIDKNAGMKTSPNPAVAWGELVYKLERPASVSLESFLLNNDDPRVARARAQLSAAKLNADGAKRAPTDWNKCESRHERARDEEKLGKKRYLTGWVDGGGKSQPREGIWSSWLDGQTERVQDLMDISGLREAKSDTDIQFKSILWNLSQNVDRSTSSAIYGITPCLTPNMIPFLTIRGGPVTGQEALSLQGIPIDLLLLTRETEDQLADLAGNAMTSTVVGTAILAALQVMGYMLEAEVPSEAYVDELKNEQVDAAEVVDDLPLVERIRGEDRLANEEVDMSQVAALSSGLLDKARRSSRMCECEGRRGLAAKVLICSSCERTSCSSCRARPEHHYVEFNEPRIKPDDFEAEIKAALPMRFTLDGFSSKQLEARKANMEELGLKVSPELWGPFVDEVSEAIKDREFHFRGLVRRSVWTVKFASTRASLELTLDPKGPFWSLFVDAGPERAANDKFRVFLREPVARLTFPHSTKTLVEGDWDVRIPISPAKAVVSISAAGEDVDAWHANLGLTVLKPHQKTRASAFDISVIEGDELLDRKVDGHYVLEDRCGTACDSLYRLEQTSWRPHSSKDGEKKVDLHITSKWTPLPHTSIATRSDTEALKSTISMPASALALAAPAHACSSADALLVASVELAPNEDVVEAGVDWHEVDLTHEGPNFFSKLAWVFARLPQWTALQEWQPVDVSDFSGSCKTCCPPPPAIDWLKVSRRICAVEDGVDAGRFEQALKARPSAIAVHTRKINSTFDFKIALNVASLAHKALGSLPINKHRAFVQEDSTTDWRLTPVDGTELDLGRPRQAITFTLPNNKEDRESAQPPHFKLKLRQEQLRSLTWMRAQEDAPTPWVEEEVAEAVLPQLGWHAEVKASRKVHIRGGVIADEVGYGKTAITLGLISSQLASTIVPTDKDRVGVKATLIIVPAHLTEQWPQEIKKFTGKGLNVITIQNVNDLKAETIATFKEADIVVVTESLFKSHIYWSHFGDFAGERLQFDGSGGRYFTSRVAAATDRIGAQLNRLRDEGASAVLKNIEAEKKSFRPVQESEDVAAKKERMTKEKQDQEEEKLRRAAELDRDPWQLASTKKDWENMHNPPLALFSFNRIVIDEFTYLEPPQLIAVQGIRASCRWILSGTPPLTDFKDIKSIANLLQVHLGVDDETEGDSSFQTKRKKERTAAEQFHSFRDVRTARWHHSRDAVGQRFLDHFARQNLAEIDEIPFSEKIVRITLPAAERAIYSELHHHLLAFDENLQKMVRVDKKKRGDREARMSAALGESKSPEEALLKRSSHFSLDMEDEADRLDSAESVCAYIQRKRELERDECQDHIVKSVKQAMAMHSYCIDKGAYEPGADKPFKMWLETIFNPNNYHGDKEVTSVLRRLCETAGCPSDAIPKWTNDWKTNPITKSLIKELDDSKGSKTEKQKAQVWKVREHVHILRKLQKELVGRYRSHRTFGAIRDAQLGVMPNVAEQSILTCCGHWGPTDIVAKAARDQKCFIDSCAGQARPSNMVSASSLCNDNDSGTFGVKLETLINIISTIPDEERVLVFVQFDDLFAKVQEAIQSYGFDVAVLTGTTIKKSGTLSMFQDPKQKHQKVLILNVADQSASGANLTVANWAIFVSPLLSETQQRYNANMTQAIGRVRRFGQTRKVNVIRLLSEGTVDDEIYEERTGRKIAEQANGIIVSSMSDYPKTSRKVNRSLYDGKGKGALKASKKRASSSSPDGSEDDADSTDSEKPVRRKAPRVRLATHLEGSRSVH